jgi:hypothetical protein
MAMKSAAFTLPLLLNLALASGFASVAFAPMRTFKNEARTFPTSKTVPSSVVCTRHNNSTPRRSLHLGMSLASISTFYKTFPLLAGFATCSVKASMADSLAQWRDTCTTKFSIRRNISMMLYSGSVLGISCEIMYNRVFPLMFGAEKTMSNIVKMTLFDGFINAPFLWLPPAYIIQAVLYGYPKREALKKYVKDVRENGLLTKYWSLWLPVSFLNFSIVPPHYRIVFVAVVSFFWMIILSVAASKDQQHPESCSVEEEPVLKNPRALE